MSDTMILARFNPETRRLTVFDEESRLLGLDLVSYAETPADALARLGWQLRPADASNTAARFYPDCETVTEVVPLPRVEPAPVTDLGWNVVPTPTQIISALQAAFVAVDPAYPVTDVGVESLVSVLTARGFLA